MGALPFSLYVMRSFSLCGVRVLHPAQYHLLDNHHGDRPKKKKTVPWLSSSRSDWHVLQRRCQPTPTPIYIKCSTASVPTEANYYMYIYRDAKGERKKGARVRGCHLCQKSPVQQLRVCRPKRRHALPQPFLGVQELQRIVDATISLDDESSHAEAVSARLGG